MDKLAFYAESALLRLKVLLSCNAKFATHITLVHWSADYVGFVDRRLEELFVFHALQVVAHNLVTWLGGGILGVSAVGLAAGSRGVALSNHSEITGAIAGAIVAAALTFGPDFVKTRRRINAAQRNR